MRDYLLALLTLIIAVTSLSSTCNAQFVAVEMVDGSTHYFPLDSVSMLTTTDPQTSEVVVTVVSSSAFPNPQNYFASKIDSVRLAVDNGQPYCWLFANAGKDFIAPAVWEGALDELRFDTFASNPQIRELIGSHVSQFTSTLWTDHEVLLTPPLTAVAIDSSLRPISDTVLQELTTMFSLCDYDSVRHTILSITPRYKDYYVGTLREVNRITLNSAEIDTEYCSNARYCSNGDIIYYKYGSLSLLDPHPENAGYYRYARASGKSTRLFF